MKEVIIPFKVGRYYKKDNNVYYLFYWRGSIFENSTKDKFILAQTSYNRYSFISLTDGNRYEEAKAIEELLIPYDFKECSCRYSLYPFNQDIYYKETMIKFINDNGFLPIDKPIASNI